MLNRSYDFNYSFFKIKFETMTEPSRRTYCLLKWLFVLNIIWLASAQSTFFEYVNV
jgi:hypothetical protein